MRNYWIAIVFVVIFLLQFIHRRYAANRIMNKLSNAFVKEDHGKEYMEILNSLEAITYFSSFARAYLRMNYYMLKNMPAEARASYEEAKSEKRIKNDDKLALYRQALAYFAEAKLDVPATEAYNGIKSLLAGKTDAITRSWEAEADMVMAVYVNRDISKIPILQELAEKAVGNDQKATYYFRLAKLHYVARDMEKTRECLIKAKEVVENKAYAKKIDRILKGDYNLL